MGRWVMGQWVKWVTFLDGSHGSWVGVGWSMTHHCTDPVSRRETCSLYLTIYKETEGQSIWSVSACSRRHSLSISIMHQWILLYRLCGYVLELMGHGSCILVHGSVFVWVSRSWVVACDPLPALLSLR